MAAAPHGRRPFALIVNADDYGLAAGVNRAVERAFLLGALSSTSIMPNQAATADASALADRAPGIGVGVHLTLTLGRPILDPSTVRSLVDPEGRLWTREVLIRRLRARELDLREVHRECVAQVERIRALGVEPDHWDSHQHIHEYFALAGVMSNAMRVSGLSRARCPRRVGTGPPDLAALDPRSLVRRTRRRRAAAVVGQAHEQPRGLIEGSADRWIAMVNRAWPGVLELVCHPADPDPAISALTPRLDLERQSDRGLLESEQWSAFLRVTNVWLATFRHALHAAPGS